MNPCGPLRAGDSVLFIDRKQRRYLRTLKPGATLRVRDGKIDCDQLIGCLMRAVETGVSCLGSVGY